MEEARGRQCTAGKDCPALGAMRQDQAFLFPSEDHVVIAGDGAAAKRREADRAFAPLEGGPGAALVG